MTVSPQSRPGLKGSSSKNNGPKPPVRPKDPPAWWDADRLQGTLIDKLGITGRMLLDYAMVSDKTVFSGTCSGILENQEEEGQQEFFSAITNATHGKVLITAAPIFGRGIYELLILWETGVAGVTIGLDGKVSVSLQDFDSESFKHVSALLGEHLLPENVRQPVYSLAESPGGGIEVIEVGMAGSGFERENYNEEVQLGFDFIVSELTRSNPIGRLAILDGPPGTGKTYFLRGLMNEILDAIFILIPPHLVEALAGPQLIPTLVRSRGLAGSDKPIILVIEDADKALVPREKGSLAAISSLLNVTDGIIGHSLNIRVLCTTNAKLDDIDPALRRASRLSRHLSVGLLSPAKASEVFSRITEGESFEFKEDTSLAAVYQEALQVEIAQDEEDDEDETDDDDDDDEDEDEDEDEDDDE